MFVRPTIANNRASTNKISPITTAITGKDTPRDCNVFIRLVTNEFVADSLAMSVFVLVIAGEETGYSDAYGELLGDRDGFGEPVGTGMTSPFSPDKLVPVPLVITPAVAAAQVKLLGFVAKRQAPW